MDELQTQLTAKIDEISKLVQQIVQFMMGNGSVSLSESMKDSVMQEYVPNLKEERRRFVNLTNLRLPHFVMKSLPLKVTTTRTLLQVLPVLRMSLLLKLS